ncbi:MAG: putative phage abortive infection protein [Rouxiella aceris]|uniref:putative phage abortive infection protein n=1 Tax=Rouxiella aceris TaxID=2703884 RepID=UPI002847A951|nr:putative phage abortive infection protein [Rouxiella aceris]MDR3434646.1 putative phage abortive infection protein [Rouxiella aceris]
MDFTLLTDVWRFYVEKTNPIVGLFTLFGALVTAGAMIYAAKAAYATKDSTEVARKSLEHAQNNTRRDEFTRHFSLLLEQHNAQLEIVKSYLDNPKGLALVKELSGVIDHFTAFNKLRGHSHLSPYMRILYHLLKFIEHNFYIDGSSIIEKKRFSSLVRSLIRNDVLFLIAVNASYVIQDNEENQYAEYQRLLNEFDFFEHALFYDASKGNEVEGEVRIETYYLNAVTALKSQYNYLIRQDKCISYATDKVSFPLPIVIASIFANPLHEKSKACIENFSSEVDKIYSQVKNEYLDNYKKQIEIDFRFCNFIGMHYFSPDADKTLEIIDSNKITQEELDNYPVVDHEYIMEAVEACRENESMDNYATYYCKLNGKKNIVLLSAADFKKDCKEYLNWVAHMGNVKGDYYDADVIAEKQKWHSFKESVLVQRLK